MSSDLSDYTVIKEGEDEILMLAENEVFYCKTHVPKSGTSVQGRHVHCCHKSKRQYCLAEETEYHNPLRRMAIYFPREKRLRTLIEAMSASGLRALRYALEV